MDSKAAPKRKCVECDGRYSADDFLPARRFGGGGYNRPGRYYDSSICPSCVIELVAGAANSRGHNNSGAMHWDNGDILRAARSLGWQGPILRYSEWRAVMEDRRVSLASGQAVG